jgi:hypothetical protein
VTGRNEISYSYVWDEQWYVRLFVSKLLESLVS